MEGKRRNERRRQNGEKGERERKKTRMEADTLDHVEDEVEVKFGDKKGSTLPGIS